MSSGCATGAVLNGDVPSYGGWPGEIVSNVCKSCDDVEAVKKGISDDNFNWWYKDEIMMWNLGPLLKLGKPINDTLNKKN